MSVLLRPPLLSKPFNLLPHPDSSCVLWLPGQDDAYSTTIRDRSGKGNHCTSTGATWARLPSGLWGLSYDGTDDRITTSAAIATTSAFTFLTWWKRMGDSGGTADNLYHRIVQSINGGTKEQNKFMVTKDGTSVRGFVTVAAAQKEAVGINITAANWHLLGLMWDGSFVYNLADGVIGDGTAAAGTLATGATALTIGWYDATSFHCNGIMALTRLLNSAISSETFLIIYNQERHLFGE